MSRLYYAKGYKNQVKKDFALFVGIYPEKDIVEDFYILFTTGMLIAKEGYAWDGSSGPTFDSKKDKIASLAHDILCQMLDLERLPESDRLDVDRRYKILCMEYGMSRMRAHLRYVALRRARGRWSKIVGDKHRIRCIA